MFLVTYSEKIFVTVKLKNLMIAKVNFSSLFNVSHRLKIASSLFFETLAHVDKTYLCYSVPLLTQTKAFIFAYVLNLDVLGVVLTLACITVQIIKICYNIFLKKRNPIFDKLYIYNIYKSRLDKHVDKHVLSVYRNYYDTFRFCFTACTRVVLSLYASISFAVKVFDLLQYDQWSATI